VRPGGSIEAKWRGKSGRYFRVLNWLSEEGLSLLTYGWEWDWVTPGPASKERDRLGGHRGAAVTVDGHLAAGMCCLAQVAAISFSARTADSRVATCAARKQDRGVDLRLR
jgi:hypothetical protein